MAQNAHKYRQRLVEARELANQFARLATQVEIEIERSQHFFGSKTNAAMKRKSLDLTAALASLRKGIS